MKNEEKVKKQAIQQLVENPTDEIRYEVIKQLPTEKINSLVNKEVEKFKDELRNNPSFIADCKKEVAAEMDNIEDLKEKVQDLEGKKNNLEKSILELDIRHKKQRKDLDEEYEREKRRNIERIKQMQNTTIDEQQKNPSFWDSLKERVTKSRFIASLIIFKMEMDKHIPIPQILKDIKHFGKRFDFYMEKPERALEQQRIYENGYGITIYDHNQDIYGKNQEKEFENDLDIDY